MAHRHLLEALDRTLRDLMDNDLPFGGKVIILSGDFQQILPVVKRGSRVQIVAACAQRSLLWHHFRIFHICENMHLLQNGESPEAAHYGAWLLNLGGGKLACDNDNMIELPHELCLPTSLSVLIDWVFPDLAVNAADSQWMSD